MDVKMESYAVQKIRGDFQMKWTKIVNQKSCTRWDEKAY